MKNYLSLLLAAAALYYFSTKKKGQEKQEQEQIEEEKIKNTPLNSAIKKIAQQAGSKLLSKKKKPISKFVKPGVTPATYKPFAGYNSFLQPRPMAPAAPKPLVYFNIFDPKFKKP